MNNPLRALLPTLAILVGLIFIVFIFRFLPIFIGVILLPMLIYYIIRHLFFKQPSSSHHSNMFSHPAGSPDSAESSGPAGVPPGPTSSESQADDRDYDIVIDSKTQKEYHIPRKNH